MHLIFMILLFFYEINCKFRVPMLIVNKIKNRDFLLLNVLLVKKEQTTIKQFLRHYERIYCSVIIA